MKSTEDDALEDPSSVEDLIASAGTRGWRNYLIYFFCAWSTFISPLNTLSYQFLGATPSYWCHVDELTSTNWTQEQIINLSVPQKTSVSDVSSCQMFAFNYTEAASIGYERSIRNFNKTRMTEMSCSRRDFNQSESSTVVTKWDLVCDRRKIYSTTQAVVYAGTLIGSLLVGGLLDFVGRKRLYLWTIPVYLSIGIITAYSPNAEFYLFMKFVVSIVGTVYYFAPLILTFELCEASQRSFLGAMNGIPWALGYMAVPGIAYYVRSFTYLQIAVVLPVITLLPAIWVLLESPRWLISKGKFKEALVVLETIAKNNNRNLPNEDVCFKVMNNSFYTQQQLKDTDESKIFDFRKFYTLLFAPGWLWKIGILFYSWFAVSMVYYGVSLNPPNLKTGKYMYLFLGGLLEIPAYLIIWWLGKYFGRKNPLLLTFLISSICIYGAMGFSIVATKEMPYEGWMTFFSLMGKFSITTGFQIIWMYTVEILPTKYRSVIVSETSISARIGSICSPYIVDLIGETKNLKWVPSAIFGSVALVAAILIYFMPNTSDHPLPESSSKYEQVSENRSLAEPIGGSTLGVSETLPHI